MKFIPAIDLKDNKCVRLKKGKDEHTTIFNIDPIGQAKFFEESGCKRIHIVDLDGAFGKSDINKDTIINIRRNTNIKIQLGGGIKNENDVLFWINQGIDFLILGSLATKNKQFVKDIIKRHNDKIYIAIDVLNKNIMIKGWVEDSKISIDDMFEFYKHEPIGGFIITDISRDGMLEGLNIEMFKEHILKTQKNIIVGGGLANYDDLKKLKKISNKNLEGVIAGKSFYSGNINIKEAFKILGPDAQN